MSVWVFGYGSLVWRPGFEYDRSVVGHIKGYERRFWQGNDQHRGSKSQLGRVATLIEDQEGVVWGKAFLLSEGDSSAETLNYLDTREAKLGGYTTKFIQFYPRDSLEESFHVLVYIATSENDLYLGPAPMDVMAKEIVEARGHCGPNTEYVLRLAEFMKIELPDIWDDHLFTLEMHLRVHLTAERLRELEEYEFVEPGLEHLKESSTTSELEFGEGRLSYGELSRLSNEDGSNRSSNSSSIDDLYLLFGAGASRRRGSDAADRRLSESSNSSGSSSFGLELFCEIPGMVGKFQSGVEDGTAGEHHLPSTSSGGFAAHLAADKLRCLHI